MQPAAISSCRRPSSFLSLLSCSFLSSLSLLPSISFPLFSVLYFPLPTSFSLSASASSPFSLLTSSFTGSRRTSKTTFAHPRHPQRYDPKSILLRTAGHLSSLPACQQAIHTVLWYETRNTTSILDDISCLLRQFDNSTITPSLLLVSLLFVGTANCDLIDRSEKARPSPPIPRRHLSPAVRYRLIFSAPSHLALRILYGPVQVLLGIFRLVRLHVLTHGFD